MSAPPFSDWQPTGSLERLRLRGKLLGDVRRFFAARNVLEVETPVLGRSGSTDLHLDSLTSTYLGPGFPTGLRLYLQTSPELAMKRLLAAGAGSIYQLSRAFRNGERGAWHNPEFTLLEWYRPGWDQHRLMDEVDELLHQVLSLAASERISYRILFERLSGIDPHRATEAELEQVLSQRAPGTPGAEGLDRDDLLDLLVTHVVQPALPSDRATFVHDYPASQAALARIRPGDPPLAERFEVFVGPVELANGFHELVDAAEQRRRFELDLERRRSRGLETPPLDERFLGALEAGLPDCAGVALGFDRLVMLAAAVDHIDQVIAFPIELA